MNPDASAGLLMAQEVDLTVGHERQPGRIVALPKQCLPWFKSDAARAA